MTRVIDYFYSAHSAYAYLGARKLMDICKAFGCQLQHKPFLLTPVMEAAGGVPFDKRADRHHAYFFGVEIIRWAKYRAAPFMGRRPTHHDAPYDIANALLIAAAQAEQDVDALSYALFRAHWVDDADLSDEATIQAVASSIGLDGRLLLQQAKGSKVQQEHASNNSEAIERGVFGSPTYFLDGEMFYGQDRLEVLEWTLQQQAKKAGYA